jgi:hypothetical protein
MTPTGSLAARIAARRPPPPPRDDRPEWIKRAIAGRLPARVDYGRGVA